MRIASSLDCVVNRALAHLQGDLTSPVSEDTSCHLTGLLREDGYSRHHGQAGLLTLSLSLQGNRSNLNNENRSEMRRCYLSVRTAISILKQMIDVQSIRTLEPLDLTSAMS